MKSIPVKVGGRAFQIRSDADPERVQELAAMVTERYESIEKRGPRADQEFRAMAMVAIVLLDELLEAGEQREKVTAKAREFAESMIEKIDGILARTTS
jgi:cell division protein ZapA (FtsZ GTPase activity inhibitor)